MTIKEDYKEVEARLIEIAREAADESEAKLASLPQDAEIERKAHKIRHNMAGICRAFAGMGYARSDPMPFRRRVVYGTTGLPIPFAEGVPPDLTDCEITFLHALISIEGRFIEKYEKEIELARKFSDDENIFKLETQLGVLREITSKWREYGRSEGFRCEY